MTKLTAHIISHTHWDREWYLPYEKHHVKLIELMDSLLEILDKDLEFKSFHLDGQTIILEDYLQIRPEMREKLEKYIREGRICIGPWYILQDEFLTSSESNIRNLIYGMKDAKRFGSVTKIGYFPDSFGNMGQAPQIVKQAGMETAIFGRGVKAIGFNNEAGQFDAYESPYAEMRWQSPDGSSVLGVLFANWYNNGAEIPVDEEKAREYWNHRINSIRPYSSTEHLLFMNGCDHQPVQRDLSKALETARKLFPEVDFVHTTFEDYVKSLQTALPSELAVIHGELRSQHTDGWWTLANTASARVYIKQLNQKNQAALEKIAEPLAAMASTIGYNYPQHLFTYAWKTLMQNHPHDSICGCSVDEVHQEMVTRFKKSIAVAEELTSQSINYISDKINTTCFEGFGEAVVPVIIYNTSGWERTGVVTTDVDIARKYESTFSKTELESFQLENWSLIDDKGHALNFSLQDLGACFGYDLPDDKFRQRYTARRVRLTFEVEGIPALGYRTFAFVKNAAAKAVACTSMITGKLQMENAKLKVAFHEDGTFDVTEKASGHTYEGMGCLEDVGDIGNEYVFVQPQNDQPILTKGMKAEIQIVEDTPFRAAFEVKHRIEIPESAEELLQSEIHNMVFLHNRKAQRASQKVILEVTMQVVLEKGGSAVKLKTTFCNNAKDHRFRMLFPTGLNTSSHLADSIFEVARRNNKPSEMWKNPSNCQHQQAFISLDDNKNGLTIANLGLNEYEVLRDEKNTIAVTLLRAVGELGDWGVFPTPEAQCLGEQTVELKIIPHSENIICSGAFIEAYQFQAPLLSGQTGIHGGMLPASYSLLKWNSPTLALSGVKRSEESGDLMVRWFNLDNKQCDLNFQAITKAEQVYLSNVIEEKLEDITSNTGEYILPVKGAQIITIGMKL